MEFEVYYVSGICHLCVCVFFFFGFCSKYGSLYFKTMDDLNL